MNTRGIKNLLFGLVVMLFSLLLALIGFLFLALDVVGSVINATPPLGREVLYIIVAALIVAVVGLAIAYIGFGWRD